MRAAVCYEYGAPLVIEDVLIDAPKTGEVKVRIAATAICHSDVHNIQGDHGSALPAVFGHEAAGIVEEVGDEVTTVKLGDRVVVAHLRSCGRCASCLTGFPHTCEGHFALNAESRLTNARGEQVVQGIRTGSFAEYVVVDQSQAVPVSDRIPFDRACLLACAVVTGFCAVRNAAKVESGKSVVVVGTGGVGINAIQGAVAAGAHPIIAVDVLDHKLESARSFGATHTVNSATNADPAQAVRDVTGGRGADYAFVTVGSTDAADLAFGMLGVRGMEVLVGVPALQARISLPMSEWVVSERTVVGSLMGSTRLSLDVPRLAQMYLDGRYKLDELVTGRYALEDINEAIDGVVRGDALRNVIVL